MASQMKQPEHPEHPERSDRPEHPERPDSPETTDSRPVVFIVDDDVGVVRAMSDDLNRRFSQDFRVVGETSPATGLAMLRGLADAHEAVALLIADNDMVEMPGVDFFGHAHEVHPLAKRVLLVERDYTARSPLVDAMTLGQAD